MRAALGACCFKLDSARAQFEGRDFYGQQLKLLIVGFIRPEANFDSLDALIAAIRHDIETARLALDDPRFAALRDDPLFATAALAASDSEAAASVAVQQ